MGEVYRARDTRLERTVAIKILSQLSSDPAHRQRFEREAKAISCLNHPNICVLHDIGHQDGIDYLVMECLEGETLAKRLEKGPLPVDGGTRPLWSRDGKELYYIALDGNLMAAEVKSRPDGSFDADAPKALFNPHTGHSRLDSFDVTKDGRFLIPRVTQQSRAPITVVVNWQAGLK